MTTNITGAIPQVNLIRASNISQCLFDFSNIISRQTIDGVVIINMNDIFSVVDSINNRGEFLKELIWKIPPEYAIICYLDARELYNKWRSSIVVNNRLEEDILLEFTKQNMNLFTDIYTHAGCVSKQMNTLISFRYDAMHITGFDFKKFVLSSVYNTVKYIVKQFESQIWLIGLNNPIDYNHISANTNFLAMVTHDFRFASFTDLLHKGAMVFVSKDSTPDITLPYMREYIVTRTVMASNRMECIKRLTGQRDKLRSQYEQIIETSEPSSHQVVFLNLDPDFDSNILDPIKAIWSSHEYVKTKNNKTSADAKSNNKMIGAGANQLESLINMLGMVAAAGCAEECEDGKETVTTDIIITTAHPNTIAGLFSGRSSHVQSAGTTKTKNEITYTQLPVLKFKNSTFQPSKLSVLNNLKFQDTKGKGSINVIIGQNITWSHFQLITEYIIENPKYPNNITAKYVDFRINPMIRINLGMMKYATEYFTLNQLGRPMEHESCHKLYNRFIRWADWIKQSSNTPTSSIGKLTQSTNNSTDQHDACTCCKCISKKGLTKYEVGNLPYVDSTVLTIIQETPTFWIPRY